VVSDDVSAPRNNQPLAWGTGVAAVTIAGCGVAAGFLALQALQLGLEPTLLRVPAPTVGGVEIIPASAGPLLEALALGKVLAGLGAGLSDGLSRRQADGRHDFAPGRSLHVNRLRFREAVLTEAARRGARIHDVECLPPPDPGVFSVDATGQRAAWCRPLARRSRASADIFMAGAIVTPGTGRLALLRHGWAYLASDQAIATVGVVGRHTRPPATPDTETCQALGLTPGSPFRFAGRRPAFVQWAAKPAVGRKLAIGDAAFHHNPIGGRGIAFALGSAFAAATTLATWRDSPDTADAARSYYQDYITSEIRRHLAFLDRETAPAPPLVHLPNYLRWAAPTVTGGLAMNSRVVVGDMFVLASGQPARWAGGIDLMRLRDLTIEAAPCTWVIECLCAQGLTAMEAQSILTWAYSQGLIGAAGPG
jgi:hypothetical protein